MSNYQSTTGRVLKRMIDLVLASMSLVVFVVPFILIALAIKFDSKGPLFFRQERIGKSGQAFRV